MYHQEDDTNSDMTSDDDMSRTGRETPPPRSSHSFSSDRDQERRGRSRDVEPRDRWSYTRNPRNRLPQRDLSLPVMSRPHFGLERDDDRRSMDYESRSQDAESYQNVVELKEDRKSQNPIQDNLENYRKLLSLGVQLAEDDRHSHMTQGYSSRSKRSAYPSTSRGLKPMPEAKKPAHRRGICEDESSHGVIMEKFIKDVSRNSRSGRGRELTERPPPRFPRPSDNWKDGSSNKRESVIQERGYEGSMFRGGFRFNADLVSRSRGLERKRRYHFDSDEKGSGHEHKSCVRKKPFECGSEMRQAMSMGSLNCPPFSESQSIDFAADPYVCDECGRSFSVISEFVEHQIMHTRENLYEYGESFIHSVAVNEVHKGQGGGKRFECKECGETFSRSAALAEHRQIHAREYLAECKDQEDEETVMPSPTFSELQKMYGKDKFYECKVCKETFLHSSALIEHQKTHGRGNPGDDRDERERKRARAWEQRERERERELGEPFLTCPNFNEFRKMYRRDKIYECKVCRESFFHLSSLREHQKIHTRGNPFENKSRMCEETFVPSQALKRRQKTYREKLFNFNNARDALMESSDPGERPKSRSWKHFFDGRGYEKPFAESQKSHTITRPPGDKEDDRPFTISTSPGDRPDFPIVGSGRQETSRESTVIHILGPAEAQKSHGVLGFTKPKPVAESSTQSSGSIGHPKVHSGGNSYEGKEYKGSNMHSLPAPRPLKRHRANDQCDEGGEPSIYISDLNKRRKIPTREDTYEGNSSNNHKDFITPSLLSAEPPSLSGESRDPNQDVTFSVPSSSVREHQKARAKKKYIESRSNEASVIHYLPFGDLQAIRRRRAKFFECQECGEIFAHRSDLIEHQKIHDRERPSGSRHYERSVIRSFAPSDPQTSYAQERFVQEQVRKFRAFGQCSATSNNLSVQKIYAQEKFYAEEPHDKETHGQNIHEKEPYGKEPSGKEPHGDEPQDKEPVDQEMHSEEPHGDEPHGQEPHGDEPHDKDPLDQEMHSEEPQGEESHGDEAPGQEKAEDTTIQASGSNEHQKDDASDTIYKCQHCGLGFADLTDLTSHQDVHSRKSLVDSREYAHSEVHVHSVSEFEKKYSGEKLYECPKCGESFIHSSLLFEHQRVHEQDQLYAVKACDDGFITLLPVRPRRNCAAEKDPAVTGSAIRCRQCGQGFIHSSALNEHMRQHRDDEILEQSELADEIFIQGLALTEYQGSETEEKLFECTICGECFFTAKQLGDHHTKVHKDEPYEYGPSYTHASFLTEPLRKHIPLYECKDCGQPFLDDTVITERMVFHPEREGGSEIVAATAQEVEANVLIPQEVLRIQGSNAEAAEPEVEAAEPEVEAAEPEVEAAEPNGEAEGPDGEAAEPDGEAEQPNGEAEQPNGDADEPDGAGIEDPEERADEPEEEEVEEPEGDADEPDGADIEDPEEEGEDQEIEVEEPYYNCHECTETFASSAAFGEHLKSHASVIIFEPANALGECSGYTEQASTSAGSAEQADDKYFKCDVCGQLFNDRLSLARHQNSHTG
ncbi:paternally-expressed gene 3 protein [Meriones unguiculatus]|uniref:paternally-expressed gene 3 protein n=1 Tax=Meriones unguiculatus TaxID=10047 RepID=UPI000B4F1B64|nr:paternally-expressed gene 3 protein [Meriones unguiculatus]XP_021514000.1 paternally-expressed gene 3 protein [Meriones unguiculatus]XP_021514001.1 paternally-expressed gene 3 protein [Meriones unguiculatus]XP_021514002.1 paternally-expressed gene 3 protein [Meriones unguiculatus]XP_021514003.1 paternally-expressed gene 3 protein [Meriones unguiculatus]XP_021514005.1 paternally-expressed gene 3 protein [Meriones unguiculatus]XP_021514006.1 paternally-expressed gene 3 protein [Meriones ungu